MRSWPPLRSHLFAYTTLFRSQIGAAVDARLSQCDLRCDVPRRTGRRSLHRQQRHIGALRALRETEVEHLDEVVRQAELAQQDRKSTRLNSSHLGISYAVFCLK